MKKLASIVLILIMMFSTFAVTVNASSDEYVKVKKATYQKYKKAYKNQEKLKTKISDQKEQIKKLKKKLEDKDSMNSWLWMNVKSLGITYDSKTWTVPKTFPAQFMINGTFYKVVIKEN